MRRQKHFRSEVSAISIDTRCAPRASIPVSPKAFPCEDAPFEPGILLSQFQKASAVQTYKAHPVLQMHVPVEAAIRLSLTDHDFWTDDRAGSEPGLSVQHTPR